jgi:hypothetical protein
VDPTLPEKHRQGPRISYCAAPDMVACAAFSKESRMKFVDSTKPHWKSGGMGRPVFRDATCRTSLRTPGARQIGRLSDPQSRRSHPP